MSYFQTPSAITQQAYSDRIQRQTETMTAGPHLEGQFVIVPSEWYDKTVSTFWKQHGFRWNAGNATWERDTQRPLRSSGKRYSAEAWLSSTRRQFYEFWPTLLKTCYYCRNKFLPRSVHQYACDHCQKMHTKLYHEKMEVK